MSYASTSKHTDNANEATSHGNSSTQLDISCSTSSYQPDSRKEEESSSSSFEVRHGFPQSAIEEFFALYRIPEEQRNPFLMFLAHIQPIIFPSTELQSFSQLFINSGACRNGLHSSNSSAALLMSPVENSNISSVNNSFDQLLMESYGEDDARDPLTNSENVNPKKDKRVRSGATVKHNDPKLYPNILCSICKEWICSRNRRLHISAHLKYHPYKCDICSYSNRSDILVRTHIKNDHGAQGNVVHETNKEIEKEIKRLSDESLQMTRDALTGEIFEKKQNCYGESAIPIRERIANVGRKRRTKILSNLGNSSHN